MTVGGTGMTDTHHDDPGTIHGAIAIVAALDTKGEEAAFVRDQILGHRHATIFIDTGIVGEPRVPLGPYDVPASEVARAAGTTLQALRDRADRGEAVAAMGRGAAIILRDLHERHYPGTDTRVIAGAIGIGGSAGASVASAALGALPLGVPKLLVSTVLSGNVAPYVGTADLMMLPSVTDIAGLNRMSRVILSNAAGAISGAVMAHRALLASPPSPDRPMIGASMFGNTTRLVDGARALLETAGYEVVVFHATGTGGRTLERLASDGILAGVYDVTTTEWADELCGGIFGAGPTRLDGAGLRGLPQVIAPGCLDMVNFGGMETVPAHYRNDPSRRFHVWNPQVTLMRTTPAENAELGRILAEKANAARGPVEVFLPLRGVSILDSVTDAGPQAFWWPEADAALRQALHTHLRPGIPLHEVDANINDQAFIEATSDAMLRLSEAQRAYKSGGVGERSEGYGLIPDHHRPPP